MSGDTSFIFFLRTIESLANILSTNAFMVGWFSSPSTEIIDFFNRVVNSGLTVGRTFLLICSRCWAISDSSFPFKTLNVTVDLEIGNLS